MWDHISKPLNVQAMFNTMARWIKPAGGFPSPQGAAIESTLVDELPGKGASDSILKSGESHKDCVFLDSGLAPQAGHGSELMKALDRLAALLQDSDADAADVLDDVVQLVHGTPMAVDLAAVRRAVDDFDFDAALAALNAMR